MSQYLVRSAGGSPRGPFATSEIRELARSGGLRPDDEVSKVGENRWVDARRVRGLFPAEAAEDPGPPPAREEPPAFADRAAPEAAIPAPRPIPSVSRTMRTPPGRLGAVDRFLRFAFGFGRAISAIVLLLAGLVVAGGIAVIAWSFVPEEAGRGPERIDPPVITTFITECTEQANAEAAARQESGQEGRAFGSFATREDPCGPYRSDIDAALRRLSLPEAEGRTVVCAIVLDLPLAERRPWLEGLNAFAAEFPEYRKKGYRCEGREALAWYVDAYDAGLRARAAREQAALQRAERRAVLRQTAIAGIGSAIGAILAFLILPLLIQIERNTRADDLRFE
jgi:hypothetical protein